MAYNAGAHFAREQTEAPTESRVGGATRQSWLHWLKRTPRTNQPVAAATFSSARVPTRPEVSHFMRGVMDEFTHLTNFARPVDASLVISVQAIHDGYIPREGVCHLHDVWGDDVNVRYVNTGHVWVCARTRLHACTHQLRTGLRATPECVPHSHCRQFETKCEQIL
jgi:hypothetical protein